VTEGLDRARFGAALGAAAEARAARRERLDRLARERRVVVYSYGIKGTHLAQQLRAAGVDCVIFDNATTARQRARDDGFETSETLPTGLPIIVGAGQNQVEILQTLDPSAYSLADALYAYDLLNSHGRMRAFVSMIAERTDALFDRYRKLEQAYRADFLAMLLYRASLDVRNTDKTRLPMGEMWTPPQRDLTSFCDVGAFDGDTLRAMKAVLPGLQRSLTLEPGAEHEGTIARTAARLGIENTHYVGAAWRETARLKAEVLFNGMLVIRQAPDGDQAAEALDVLAAGATYDYIKFDVEGAEREALDGGAELLRRARCIAIAAYHLPNDILDLPDQLDRILGTGAGWRWGFRHYSQSFDDSIFYAFR
jgi:FkbM family methyltransferase